MATSAPNPYARILTSLPKPGGGEYGKFYCIPALDDERIGHLSMHGYSPFVVHLTTGGISRPFYGGVCMTGSGGEGYFYPTWVAA